MSAAVLFPAMVLPAGLFLLPGQHRRRRDKWTIQQPLRMPLRGARRCKGAAPRRRMHNWPQAFDWPATPLPALVARPYSAAAAALRQGAALVVRLRAMQPEDLPQVEQAC